MQALQARALLFQRKLAYQDYNGSIPGVPELDGQLGILELTGTITTQVDRLAKDSEGVTVDTLQMAGMIANGLIMRDSKERVFSDTDIEGVAGFGLLVLIPLATLIADLSGVSKDAIERAKKNLKVPPANTSATSLPAKSEGTPGPN